MKCLKCGESNPEVAAYCQRCNTYLVEPPASESGDVFKAFILASLVTGVFYLVFPIPVTRNAYVLQLFTGRISELIFALCAWSLALVAFHYHRHRLQDKALEALRHHELHHSYQSGIYVREVEERIAELSRHLEARGIRKFQSTVVFQRIRRILLYLRAVPKKEEIQAILNYQAEIDHNRLQGRYTLLNVFIWAIPILGFIGTVYGIGESIGEFSEFIRSADSGSVGGQLRSALGGVTNGLSIAFNTTFLALMGVIPIMVLASMVRKGEEGLLLNVEEYCLEELLPHLHVHPGRQELENVTQAQLEQLTNFTEQWTQQAAPVLNSVGEHAKTLEAQVAALQPVLRDFSAGLLNQPTPETPPPEIPTSTDDATAAPEVTDSNPAAAEEPSRS